MAALCTAVGIAMPTTRIAIVVELWSGCRALSKSERFWMGVSIRQSAEGLLGPRVFRTGLLVITDCDVGFKAVSAGLGRQTRILASEVV
jgi:hypothetical protein